MKYITGEDAFCNVAGTHFQGYIKARYSKLVELFGESWDVDDGKTDANWYIRFEDGTVATIYNWQDGYNYCGEDGLDVKYIGQWNVGGHSAKALALVKSVLL